MHRLRFGVSTLAFLTAIPAAAADAGELGGNVEVDASELHERVYSVSAERLHATLVGSRLEVEANLSEGSLATIASQVFGFGDKTFLSIGIETEVGGFEETRWPETMFCRPMRTQAELFGSFVWSASDETTLEILSHSGCTESDVRALDCATDVDTPLPGTRRFEFGANHESSSFAFSAFAWLLQLERNLDWATAPPVSAASARRVGADLSLSIDLSSTLRVESTVLASSSSTGAAATRFAATAKLALETEIGLFANLGLRSLIVGQPESALNGPPLLDSEIGYHTADVEVGLEIENALDTRWPVAQLRCNANSAACTAEAFSPSQPLTGKLIAKLRY